VLLVKTFQKFVFQTSYQ